MKALRPFALLAALLPGLLLPLGAEAQRRVEIYRVQYRTAEEMLPLAETALAGEGRAAVDRGTNSLVLVGPDAAVEAALGLLRAQDRKPRTIVLHYGTRRAAELDARGVDVRWTAEAGDFRIGNLVRPPGSGSEVRVRAEDDRVRLDEDLSGVLRIVEGTTGRIETGTTVPFATRDGFGGTQTEFVTASTGFEAEARVLGDGRVQVDLLPFAGRFLRGGAIERTGGGMVVMLEPGETAVVGGLSQAADRERDETLRGFRDQRTRDDTVLLLRAEVE